MTTDRSLRLMNGDGRPVAFVAITGTDVEDGETETVVDAIEDAAADAGVEVVHQ